LGTPFSILSFKLMIKCMHLWLVNCWNVSEECTAFISLMLQLGGGKKNTGHCWAHVESTLHKFFIPLCYWWQ
jgi:hypothetical protein